MLPWWVISMSIIGTNIGALGLKIGLHEILANHN